MFCRGQAIGLAVFMFGTGLLLGSLLPILSAGVADCTGSDRGRAVPAAVLKEGKA